jgi:hypothetical protein
MRDRNGTNDNPGGCREGEMIDRFGATLFAMLVAAPASAQVMVDGTLGMPHFTPRLIGEHRLWLSKLVDSKYRRQVS